jgi:hypothetical protein
VVIENPVSGAVWWTYVSAASAGEPQAPGECRGHLLLQAVAAVPVR